MRAFVWLLGFVALLWVIAVAQWAGLDLRQFGVTPRDTSSLLGILLHIFVHDGFWHLLSNTGPLLALGGIVGVRGSGTLLAVSVFIAVFAGAGVWLVGRDGVHIGASGLIFGYFGYLVARGFVERSLMSLLITVAVTVFYGSLIFGLLPVDGFISWEGHLFGLIGGVLLAWVSGRDRS
ncbi:MAG: rhomboid family intramembrane serine protease [Dehalococcoidia bacterium]|nr:rhomboid family intramembrane serine protease [Dehalococcoidia bacterium]